MLDEIVAKQRIQLPEVIKQIPLKSFENKIIQKNFVFSKKLLNADWSLIAECKVASPVKGIFEQNKNIEQLAKIYEENGATALSVHTNQYFKGQLEDMEKVKNIVSLPVMRKEFIIHPYQIYQTAYAGADALLLIARILEGKELKNLLQEAKSLGLDCLVEVHDEADLYKTLDADAQIVGINNRDLKSFKTDIKNTVDLKPLCDDKLVISESGIKTKEDLLAVKAVGVNGVLIGEGLVTANDIAKATRQMALIEEEV